MNFDQLQTLPTGANRTMYEAKSQNSTLHSFHAELVMGSGPKFSAETRRLLKNRLGSVALMLLVATLVMVVRNLFFQEAGFALNTGVGLTMCLAVVAIVCTRRQERSMRFLRLLEIFTIGITVLFVGMNNFLLVSRSVLSGQEQYVLAQFERSVVPCLALVLLYGTMIPNTVSRAAAVIVPIGFVPLIVRIALRLRFPEISELLDFEETSFSALFMMLGVGIAIYGTYVMNNLRVREFQARRLGQYQLVEKIGSGGMGEVWKAEHQMLARPAAIKLIQPEMLGAQDKHTARMVVKRFEREAQATAGLTSPHSIVIYDFGTAENGSLYYVMELLDGLDVESVVNRFGPFPPARVSYILRQACASLADAHHRGLTHRDIKPANIFLCRMGQLTDFVKVLDFGLVKARESRTSTQLTQLGTATGTPAFIAPEQALGSEVDGRTDLYALGCVGYWMLTGQLVFQGGSATSMVIDHVKTAPIPPSKRTEQDIPIILEELIMNCLEKDPEKRPTSATEVGQRIEESGLSKKWGEEEARRWWDLHLPREVPSNS